MSFNRLRKADLLRCPPWPLLTVFLAALLLTGSLIGCGERPSGAGGGIGGGLTLTVRNARRPARFTDQALPDLLQAASFRVVVSAADFSPPIEVFFPGDATGGVVEGIPIGENRSLLVEAINAEGRVVRRREIHGIRVKGGKTTQVEMALLSVPIITNLTDGLVLTNSRLRVLGYGEPAAPLEFMDEYQGNETILADISTHETVIAPSLSDGTFSLQPPVLAPGIHTLRVRDQGTGEEAVVTVSLVSPGRMPGTTFSTAGSVRLSSDRPSGVVTTVGLLTGPRRSVGRSAGPVKDFAFFPDVVTQITTEEDSNEALPSAFKE